MSPEAKAVTAYAAKLTAEFESWLQSSQSFAMTCRLLTESGIGSRDRAVYQAAKAAYFGGKAAVLAEKTKAQLPREISINEFRRQMLAAMNAPLAREIE